MKLPAGYLQHGEHVVEGVLAEVLSVLESSIIWKTAFAEEAEAVLEGLFHALDTRIPHEERVGSAVGALRAIRRRCRKGSWVAWYGSLPDHEYSHEFYEGYRDHTIHSLQVFLLGAYLYETVTPLREGLDRRLSVGADLRLTAPQRFLEWWVLASLWHDIGYIFEASDFISDKDARRRRLAALSARLSEDPFLTGLAARGITLDHQHLRDFYRAGRYFPLSIDNIDFLFRRRGIQVVDDMWGRLLQVTDASDRSLVRELDRLTTQAAVGRPPFHDHGIFGALLLSYLLEEVEVFLTNLAQSRDITTIASRPTLEQWWEEFASTEGIEILAIEAIAFHNFSPQALDSHESRTVFRSMNPVKLAAEPHLFFLALTDTLQNWDRHHFVPRSDSEPPLYKPAMKSSEMLLQGQGPHLAIGIRGDAESIETVKRLFGGWLDKGDIDSLICDGARFTRTDRVQAIARASMAEISLSEQERQRLERRVQETIESSRRTLLEGQQDAVLKTSALIGGLMQRISEGERVLTLSDRDAVEKTLAASGLRVVEEQACLSVQPGTRLEMGTVRRQIGSGGFGRVFTVSSDEAGPEEFAFKLMHSADLANTEKRRLFKRGYTAMTALSSHPSVVNVFRYSEVPVGFFMKFIAGPDLEDGLRQLDDIHSRIAISLTVAETLAFAHSRGVLHRDIKPGNVILDSERDYAPVLTDFDLAWIDSRTQLTKGLYASHHYGAPEQSEKRWKHFTTKPTVDVYGLGALIYYLMTEQDPPPVASWSAESWKLIDDRLEGRLPAVVVVGVRELIQRCTKKQPEQRIQSMDEVVGELSRLEAGASLSANERMGVQAWLAEVFYRATGVAGNANHRPVTSRTGGVSWRVARTEPKGGDLNVDFVCTLNYEPRAEGVNFEGFQRGTVKQVDQRIQEFRQANAGMTAARSGFLRGAGSEMHVKVEHADQSLLGANAMAQLLASITRLVE